MTVVSRPIDGNDHSDSDRKRRYRVRIEQKEENKLGDVERDDNLKWNGSGIFTCTFL